MKTILKITDKDCGACGNVPEVEIKTRRNVCDLRIFHTDFSILG
jgi:hypothetical protein